MLDADGLVVQGQRGAIKNPAWQILRDAADTMIRYGARFGLTPSDWANIRLDRPNKDYAAADYLSRPAAR